MESRPSRILARYCEEPTQVQSPNVALRTGRIARDWRQVEVERTKRTRIASRRCKPGDARLVRVPSHHALQQHTE